MTSADWDNQLLVRMRSGEEAAFVELYRKLQPSIYRFALHMTGSRSVAEDVTQETFLALIGDDFGYLPERGTLAGYLFGVARKLVLRYLERMQNGPERGFDSAESGRQERTPAASFSDPVAGLIEREGLEELRRAVVSLPRRYREVVVLCDLQEIDYADAASLLGCPVGTVRSRLHRARALLLDKLQRREPRYRVRSLTAAGSLI
ncbi:MAG TPA: RNA polymerase sigma factor [Bryobacteraceae bacterium]|nr:RNA polymerase sigma factor [Bryobacteraceae bacterium]